MTADRLNLTSSNGIRMLGCIAALLGIALANVTSAQDTKQPEKKPANELQEQKQKEKPKAAPDLKARKRPQVGPKPILHRSIEFGLGRREEAVAYALGFARDMERELADQFVGMYVNKWTLDFGDVGRGAVDTLLGRGREAGLLPACGDLDFIRP